jgi:hypothetical protein
MKFRSALFCFSLLLVSSVALRGSLSLAQTAQNKPASPSGPPPAVFNYGGNAAEVPAEFVGNLVFLPVRINEGRPSGFFLDTTAAASSIAPSRLTTLSIPSSPRIVLSLIGVDVPFAPLPAVPRPAFDFEIGRAFDGALGADFFQRVVVEVDYARQTVRLYDPSTYNYSGPGTMFHLDLSTGLPVVQAKFADPKGKVLEGDFIISTANDTTLVLFDRYAESRHILSSHWKTVPSIDPALNSSGISATGRLKSLEIGRFMSEDMLATITKSDLPGSSDPKIAGMIGAAWLSRFTVVFDYPHQQMFLTPNARFSSDDQEDKSGISVVAKGNSLRIFEVVDVNPGSPGAKGGVQKGDVIAGIDEEPAADLTLSEIRSLFRQVGHKYNLAIERNGQSKQINVEMKRQLN